MTESWYDTSYRKLFFDFHCPGATVGLAAAFDAESWAARLEEANAQAASVFAKGAFGWSYYRKGSIRYIHPHLPPEVDMLEQQISALHSRELRAIGYYHTFYSEPVAQDHPDWLERCPDGSPRDISICMLSPLTEQWMLPHIEEIVSLYDVDAMFFDGTWANVDAMAFEDTYTPRSPCYCASCQERFARASGGQAIPRERGDPAWPRYVSWALEAFKDVRQAICDVVHAQRPEVVVSFNWAYMPRQPEVPPESIGSLVADIYPDDQAFNGSYTAHYWAMSGRPFDIMNSAFLQWWGDWGCKPAVALQQEAATVVANGGLTWIGYQMNERFDVEPAVLGEMGQALAFVKERESLLHGAEPIPYVAVLHSTSANLACDEPGFRSESTLRGAHRALTESMIPYHFLHEEKLLTRLDEFRAVILPDQRYLSPDLVEALVWWVNDGGVLLATALAGTLDETYRDTKRFVLAELLGVRYERVFDQPHAYIEVTDDRLKPGTLDMPHLAEASFALAQPVNDEVKVLAKLRRPYLRSDGGFLLRWSPVGEDSGYPAITVRQVGNGHAAYIAGEVFQAYQVKNQWNLKHIVANLLNLLIAEPMVEVDAPAWLEVVLMRQPSSNPGSRERTLVHLVNHHGWRPVDGNNYCLEQVLPVLGVTLRLRRSTQPIRVTLEPGTRSADWGYSDGIVKVRLPKIDIHTAVAIA